MAHVGSCVKMSSNAFSAALYQNECSIATARSKAGCTFGSHEVENVTVPSLLLPDSSASWAKTVTGARKSDATRMGRRRSFIVLSSENCSMWWADYFTPSRLPWEDVPPL